MDHFLPLTEFPQRKVKTAAAGSLRSPFQSRTRMISNKGYRRSKRTPQGRPPLFCLPVGYRWEPVSFQRWRRAIRNGGKPILGQIDSRQLTDMAVVVVRYFGGTLLGVPGWYRHIKQPPHLLYKRYPSSRSRCWSIMKCNLIIQWWTMSCKWSGNAIVRSFRRKYSFLQDAVGYSQIQAGTGFSRLSDLRAVEINKKSWPDCWKFPCFKFVVIIFLLLAPFIEPAMRKFILTALLLALCQLSTHSNYILPASFTA